MNQETERKLINTLNTLCNPEMQEGIIYELRDHVKQLNEIVKTHDIKIANHESCIKDIKWIGIKMGVFSAFVFSIIWYGVKELWADFVKK